MAGMAGTAVILVATHWGTLYGGINSLNYSCARALAEHLPSSQVHVLSITANPKLEKAADKPKNLFIHTLSDESDVSFALTGNFNEPYRARAVQRVIELAQAAEQAWIIGHDTYTGFIAYDAAASVVSVRSGRVV